MQEVKRRYLIEEKEYSKGSLINENAKIGGIIEITNLDTNKASHKEWKRFYDDGNYIFSDRNKVIEMLMGYVTKNNING